MAEIDQISSDLFFKLRNRFPNIEMGSEDGTVTTDPKKARFFTFNYKVEGQNFGSITCSLIDNQSLKIYFSQDITEEMQEQQQDHWFQFLREMRRFAKGHMLMFDVRDIAKHQLDQEDIKFLSQTNKGDLTESRVAWERKGRFSNGAMENVRIHVVHQNKMDENPHNRLSKIDKIYLVNGNNERFLLPFKSVLGAKAMAAHVNNGGTPYDAAGQDIAKAVHEMRNLQRFNLATRNAEFESEQPQKVREASAYLKEQLKNHLYQIANNRNIEENLKQLSALVTLEDARADVSEEMKQWFIQKHYNENLNNWIESAALAYKKFEEQQMNTDQVIEKKEDEKDTDYQDHTAKRAANPAVIGDTIKLYDNPQKDEEMKKLLKTQPLRGMVSLIFADIAQRAVDDETAILASRAESGEFTMKHKQMLQSYMKDLFSDSPDREVPAERRHIVQPKRTASEEFEQEIMSMGEESDCGCQHNEEEQIDEINANQIKKDIDSGMSIDAVIGKHANKRMSNTDEIRKVIKQHAWDKRMKKTNEQELEEEPNEGNEFSGALAKAKAAGAKTFKVGDKEYEVKENETVTEIGKHLKSDRFKGLKAIKDRRNMEENELRRLAGLPPIEEESDASAAANPAHIKEVEEFLTDLLNSIMDEPEFASDAENLKDNIATLRSVKTNGGLVKALTSYDTEFRDTVLDNAEETLSPMLWNIVADLYQQSDDDEDFPKGDQSHLPTSLNTMLQKKTMQEADKPDYLDFDDDGDKEESMKKALKDKEEEKMDENELRRLAGLPVVEMEIEAEVEAVEEENLSEAQKIKFLGYNTTTYPLAKAIADKAYREGTLVKLTMDAAGKPVAVINDPSSAGEYEAHWSDQAGSWVIDFD